MNDNIVALEEEFYSKPFYFSYSSLSRLNYAPNLFYKDYILRKKEESTESHLVEGKVIHCKLLDDKSFDKQFIIMQGSVPSENTKKVIDSVYFKYKQELEIIGSQRDSLAGYEPEILEMLLQMNLHQSLKTDKQRLDKIITQDSEVYFDFLKKSERKIILDAEIMERCEESVSVVKENEAVVDLLKLDSESTKSLIIINESLSQMDLTDYPFGLKGIIDNCVIDHENKTIKINDLKKTGKSLVDFPESVEYFNYCIQSVVYMMLAKYCTGNPDDYKVEFRFVVIDKYNQVYPFLVSPETVTKWELRLTHLLEAAKYHYESRNYKLPYRFIKEGVYL